MEMRFTPQEAANFVARGAAVVAIATSHPSPVSAQENFAENDSLSSQAQSAHVRIGLLDFPDCLGSVSNNTDKGLCKDVMQKELGNSTASVNIIGYGADIIDTEKERGKFDFSIYEKQKALAQQLGIHTNYAAHMVWYKRLPDWLLGSTDKNPCGLKSTKEETEADTTRVREEYKRHIQGFISLKGSEFDYINGANEVF